ncbi:MAG: 50S ribosomal protein L3 N(5)-glutamine methyltransferase [Nevskiales bacterium]
MNEVRTARELVLWAERELAQSGAHFGHGTDNPRDEAVLLVFHAAGLPWDAAEEALSRVLPAAARKRAVELVQERIRSRKPAAYLTGEAWFCGLRFKIDERVIVPRSSLGELIESGFEPWLREPPQRVLELCTGSGCIAIACALAFPEAAVDATDLSDAALAIARENQELHSVGERLRLHRADVFEGLPPARYELIVSNPPYVGEGEMATLPEEYRHEPRMALEAAEEGLAIVRRILEGATDWLASDGLLVVEVGNSEPLVQQRWPDLPLIWPEFQRGEGGVFIISAQDLREWRNHRR